MENERLQAAIEGANDGPKRRYQRKTMDSAIANRRDAEKLIGMIKELITLYERY